MLSDWILLEEIKQEIAKGASLQDTPKWSQKDFEFLSYYIEEKTACRLSISTLKRIWSNSHQRLPHITTLDALSKTAFGKNWKMLKSDTLAKKGESREGTVKNSDVSTKGRSRKKKPVWLLVIPVLLVFLGGGLLLQKKSRRPPALGQVSFSHSKAMENQLPNSVVFTYDIDAIAGNRFFLQQSWDTSRKVEIFKKNYERTDIYYIPGYFTAKLIADDQIVKELPVHVIYKDWFMAARQPMSNIVTFDKDLWLGQNHLGIAKETLEMKGIDVNKAFQLAYYYVKDFEVDGDNLTYSASFKMDVLENVDCPIMNIHLQGTKGYYWIMMGNEGCGSELGLIVGDTSHNGKTQDLSGLTTNMYQWNEFEIQTIDRNVRILLNGKEVLVTDYETAIGGIMEISYFFNGMGMIDNVALYNQKEEEVFSERFE